MKQIKVEEHVYDLLALYERARNNDTYLMTLVLKRLGWDAGVEQGMLSRQEWLSIRIPMEKIDQLPSFESITRARRKIQARGQFLPTDREVILARMRKQEEMRDYAVRT